jgi:hypothetical protein
MQQRHSTSTSLRLGWRHLLLLFIVFGTLDFMLSLPPIAQDPLYHDFADRRTLFNLPNFFDVMSNLPFLLVGIAGMRFCLRNLPLIYRPAWFTFFAGVTFVSVGSAYYHCNPNSDTLLWDRLPMTIAFMGLFMALLGEYVHARLIKSLLLPAILLGMSSVFYWRIYDDLRFYAWIQLMPLLIIPYLALLFRPLYTRQSLLLVALGCYVLAKLAETYDRAVFVFTQNMLSGHSIKHLLASLACLSVLLMLKTRMLRKDVSPT